MYIKKRIVAVFLSLFFSLVSTGALAAWKYQKPYDDVVYENIDMSRIEQNMPTPFSVDALTKIAVGECDFNSAATSDSLSLYQGQKYWSADTGKVVINKTQNTSAESFVLQYTPSEKIMPGDYYIFSCRIKTEGVEKVAPKIILEAWGDRWIAAAGEYGKYQNVIGNSDWYTMIQTLKIPEGTTSLRLQAYLPASLTGTVYFDDFMLYKVALDPMESVLCFPNYKGLIYGDDSKDIDLNVKIAERSGFYDYDDMKLIVRLVDENETVIYKSEPQKIAELMNFVFPVKELGEGDYYLQSILSDKITGEVISQNEHTIRKRAASYRPETYVDSEGHLILNGEKTFFKRMYNGGENYFSDVADFAVSAKLDTVRLGGTWWANTNRPVDHVQGIKTLQDNGITADIPLSSYWMSNLQGNAASVFINNQTDIPKLFYSIAKDYKNTQMHAGYYLFDEPNPITEGEEIRWNNEIFAQVDIDHPTYGVADKNYDEYGIYVKMADVLGIDPYPIRGKEGITDDIARVGRDMREITKNFPNRPVYIVLQGFNYTQEGALRGPSEAELHNMAWQAICEGADGVDWYAYPEMNNDTAETLEQWKSKLLSVYNEIELYKNVIVSDEPVPRYNVSGDGDWLNLTLRRLNGKTYLFAVNNTYTAHNAIVKIDGAGNYSLNFEPLEVKKIEIEQDEFLSPQAELKMIGFSNGTEIFSVAKGDENVLYVNENSGVINYCANISDGAKLFIGGKEMPLNGKITVRCADTFSVCVVAEDGQTQSCTMYKVVKK